MDEDVFAETAEFVEIADEDDLWDDEMEAYDLDDSEILLVRIDGEYHAYHGICPHQSVSLVEGSLDAGVLRCRAHEWLFDASTGKGINPRDACLRRHLVRVEDGVVKVSRHPMPAEAPST